MPSSRVVIPIHSAISARTCENGASVVRVFLPDAEEVAVIDDEGHERDLERIHDAGLFEGRLGNGLRRYRVRARYGERQVEIEDPYRFPPILSDFDLYLLGEGTHMHPLREARRSSHGARRGGRRRLRGLRARGQAGQRRRRFQFLGRPAPCHARARQRLLGNLRARSQARDQIQIRDHRARRPHAAVEVRPLGIRRRAAAADRFDRRRPEHDTAPAALSSRGQRVERADIDLRSASRLVAAASATQRALAQLSRAGRAIAGLCARYGLHPRRIPAGQRASLRRILGLSADRTVCADQSLRHSGRFRRPGRGLPPRGTRRHSRLGAGTLPRRSARPRSLRRHRALRA